MTLIVEAEKREFLHIRSMDDPEIRNPGIYAQQPTQRITGAFSPFFHLRERGNL
jgi:hypothetical protein